MHTMLPPISDRRIRFALVGCGRIAKNHIDALRLHADQCEIVGVCDPDARAVEEVAAATSSIAYRDLGQMLDQVDADAVILTTPSGLHASQSIAVAGSGRHVITEKPMATRWDDGKRMVAACDAAGVRLFVVKQIRRTPPVRLLKRAIDKKRFGRLYTINMNVFWTRPQDYYDSSKWRGTWEFDGGALMNQASHYVDLLDWIIGPVESVQAYTATLGREIQTEDTGVMSLRWRNGALGTMNVTMLTYPRNLEASMTIIGEKGTVRIGGPAMNVIQHWQFTDPEEDEFDVAAANTQMTSVQGSIHSLYYDNVIKVLRGQAAPETDGREGLKTLELLVAIYMSARDGRRIGLPLEL